uniref:Uncharacterized protein n=4 Tax=Triticinae TaxID=1648030 RepID=A0A453FXQ1_AEGTS
HHGRVFVLGIRCPAFPLVFLINRHNIIFSYRATLFLSSPVPLTLSLSKLRGAMHDWAPAIIATALFALLCPGGILQLPGRQRTVDFMNLRTSCLSILVHAVIYGVLLMLFVVILQAHLYV